MMHSKKEKRPGNRIYYSDEQIGYQRVRGFSNFTPIEGDIFLGKEPSIDDIKQTTIGDCYFLAALKAIVRRNPSYIHDLIEELDNGRVVVRLYYIASENPLTVTKSLYELDKTAVTHVLKKATGKGHDAPWVYLLEKAFAIHRLRNPSYVSARKIELWKKKEGKSTDAIPPALAFQKAQQSRHSPQDLRYDDVLSAGGSQAAFSALLGSDAEKTSIPDPNHDLLTLLRYQGGLSKLNIFNENTGNEHANEGMHVRFMKSYLNNLNFNRKKMDAYQKKSQLLLAKIIKGVATVDDVEQHFKTTFVNPPLDEDILSRIAEVTIQGLGKRKKQYGPDAKVFFQRLKHQLESGELITIATPEELQNKVGLVGNHVYEVINCYERNGHYFVLISNPWARKSRGYTKSDSDLLKPIEQDSSFFGTPKKAKEDSKRTRRHKAEHLAIHNTDYDPNTLLTEPGTFEIELIDCMNNFTTLYTTNMAKTIDRLTTQLEPLREALETKKTTLMTLIEKRDRNKDKLKSLTKSGDFQRIDAQLIKMDRIDNQIKQLEKDIEKLSKELTATALSTVSLEEMRHPIRRYRIEEEESQTFNLFNK